MGNQLPVAGWRHCIWKGERGKVERNERRIGNWAGTGLTHLRYAKFKKCNTLIALLAQRSSLPMADTEGTAVELKFQPTLAAVTRRALAPLISSVLDLLEIVFCKFFVSTVICSFRTHLIVSIASVTRRSSAFPSGRSPTDLRSVLHLSRRIYAPSSFFILI